MVTSIISRMFGRVRPVPTPKIPLSPRDMLAQSPFGVKLGVATFLEEIARPLRGYKIKDTITYSETLSDGVVVATVTVKHDNFIFTFVAEKRLAYYTFFLRVTVKDLSLFDQDEGYLLGSNHPHDTSGLEEYYPQGNTPRSLRWLLSEKAPYAELLEVIELLQSESKRVKILDLAHFRALDEAEKRQIKLTNSESLRRHGLI
jgi:hypothetical protein